MANAAASSDEGGGVNSNIGTIEYYGADIQGRFQFFCSSNLFLASGEPQLLQLTEQRARIGVDGRCPSQDRVTVQTRDGQIYLEWRNNRNNKVRMKGWAQRSS